MQMRFLATGTLLCGAWSWNEDTYLAQLLFLKHNEAAFVRLFNAYPNEWPVLTHEKLTSQLGTILRVTRDSECDRRYARMELRTHEAIRWHCGAIGPYGIE
jgi:hypothetical protein